MCFPVYNFLCEVHGRRGSAEMFAARVFPNGTARGKGNWREFTVGYVQSALPASVRPYTVAPECASPSVPHEKRGPFFAQALSCCSMLLALILLPGRAFVTHQKLAGNRESRSVCIPIYYTSKRGSFRSMIRPPWECSAAGSADLEESQAEQKLNN